MSDDKEPRRTVSIESIDVRLSEEGKNWQAPSEFNLEAEEVYEISKVVTHVQFYKNGQAGLWVDITIGNKHPELHLKLRSIGIGLKNSNKKVTPDEAKAGEGFNRELPEELQNTGDLNYMWNEKKEREELDHSWTTMYDFYEDSEEIIPFYDTKGAHEYDRIFFHEAGSGDTKQHLITEPMKFNPDEKYYGDNKHQLNSLKRMVSQKDIELLPNETMGQNCPANDINEDIECDDADHRNAGSLWAHWERINVMRDQTQIDFNFEFGIDSEIGEIKNLYMYYILPENARFHPAKSKMGVFQPRKNHWMFGAWWNETGIDRTGPENRILRSKNQNAEFDADLGTYKLEQRQTANDLLQNLVFTVIPAIFGTLGSALLTAELFSSSVSSNLPVVEMLIGMLILLGVVLWYGIYTTILGRYTYASKFILLLANITDYVWSIITRRLIIVYYDAKGDHEKAEKYKNRWR